MLGTESRLAFIDGTLCAQLDDVDTGGTHEHASRPSALRTSCAEDSRYGSRMRVLLTPLDPRTHRLEVVREGGTRDARVLETRSYIVHDLAHFAVEAEAAIPDGVFGLLARGAPLDGLGTDERATSLEASKNPGLARAESLAGPFQSLWHGRLDADRYAELVGVDRAFVDRALARMRGLMGHWNATRHGQTMELRWPPR